MSFNTNHIDFKPGTDVVTDAGRPSLEQTVAHEMMHAFMFEAMTSGMTAINSFGVTGYSGRFSGCNGKVPGSPDYYPVQCA